MAVIERDEITEKLGGYNEMPPNWKEINQGEFLWKWEVSPANRQYVFRQVSLPSLAYGSHEIGSAEIFCGVHFWVFPDLSGIGWITHYNGNCTAEDHGYMPQYFQFKWCLHEYETIVSRMCYREFKCKKCGYHYAVDSSD